MDRNLARFSPVPYGISIHGRAEMDNRRFTRSGAAILALSFSIVSPAFAQAITKESGAGTGKMTGTEKAAREAGPHGADVTSSEPSQSKTAETGVEASGTTSTNPGQSG